MFFRRAWNGLARRWIKVSKLIPDENTMKVEGGVFLPVPKAQTYTQCLAASYWAMVDWPVINMRFLNRQIDRNPNITDKQEDKFKKNKHYKEYSLAFVYHLANINDGAGTSLLLFVIL